MSPRAPPWPATAAARRRCPAQRHRQEPQARDQRSHQHRAQPLRRRGPDRCPHLDAGVEVRRMVEASTMSPSTATPLTAMKPTAAEMESGTCVPSEVATSRAPTASASTASEGSMRSDTGKRR